MSMPATYNIVNYQGDTYTVVVSLEGDWTTGSTPKLEIKVPNAGSPSLELFSGTGITIGAYSGGFTAFTVVITSAQSNTLGSSTVYWYDFEVTVGSITTTYISGSFVQTAQVSA